MSQTLIPEYLSKEMDTAMKEMNKAVEKVGAIRDKIMKIEGKDGN